MNRKPSLNAIEEIHFEKNEIDKLIQEILEMQHKKLLECGRRIIPNLTTDDILQPNDFLQLETYPLFRYEEGVLAGIQTIQTAIWALRNENF